MTHLARASWARSASSLSLSILALTMAACGTSTSDDPQPADVAPASSPPADRTAARADLRSAPVTRAAPAQRERFALLRTRPEGLPAHVRGILRTPIMGMNWALAQRLPVRLPGAYWLVPGRGHLCIVDQGSLGNPGVGTACTPTAEALVHGIASVTVAMPRDAAHVGQARLIVGVVPDGVRRVRVTTRGQVASAAVTGTLFVLRDALAAPPDQIAWR